MTKSNRGSRGIMHAAAPASHTILKIDMQIAQICTRVVAVWTPLTVTAPKARAAIAEAHEQGFMVTVDSDNWLVLKRQDLGGEPLSVDLKAATWVEDLRALLHATLLIDLSRDGALADRKWKPEAARN